MVASANRSRRVRASVTCNCAFLPAVCARHRGQCQQVTARAGISHMPLRALPAISARHRGRCQQITARAGISHMPLRVFTSHLRPASWPVPTGHGACGYQSHANARFYPPSPSGIVASSNRSRRVRASVTCPCAFLPAISARHRGQCQQVTARAGISHMPARVLPAVSARHRGQCHQVTARAGISHMPLRVFTSHLRAASCPVPTAHGACGRRVRSAPAAWLCRRRFPG